MLSKLAVFSSLALAAEPNPPTWDEKSVKVFTPGQPDAQAILDQIHAENGGKVPINNGQFSSSRYALLFKPGQHNVNVDMGYYVSVHGLGRQPTDSIIGNLMTVDSADDFTIGALNNFWRSAENVHVVPNGPMIWAVSQAAPLRRAVIDGDLNLFHYTDGQPAAGYASGGFMADVKISGTVSSGSQQQFLLRNCEFSNWQNGVWNMVFVGTPGAPETHCGNEDGAVPSTNINATPSIAEKPYIVMDGEQYKLMVPNLESNKVGVTPGFDNAKEIDFANVYVASSTDSAATINAKLAEPGMNLVLQPGIYNLEDSIKVTQADTVVFGMGLVTLVATTGKPCIEVGDVDGVRVSGILFQAGEQNSDALLKWGSAKDAGSAANPGVMHDIFARVGGPDATEVKTETMVQVNRGNVIIDDTWLWRADHDINGPVANGKNPVATGLQINGDDVIGYGLAAEHTLGNLLEWNGENGQTFFYQSEYPYDVDQSYGDQGYAAYRVADNVTKHTAWGVGVYSYFRDHTVAVHSGIKTPQAEGIQFTNSLTVFLNGQGEIDDVINDDGKLVRAGQQLQYHCDSSSASTTPVDWWTKIFELSEGFLQ